MGNNKKRNNKKTKFLFVNSGKSTIGFPFIILGFMLLPLIISIAIAFTEDLDFYTIIILTGLASIFVTSGFYIPLSVYEKYFEKKEKILNFLPPVTIIIPAFNEQAGISRTLESIVEADYPNKEVIVIDDGSTDQTYRIALKYKNKFKKDDSYSVFRKPNGGKSSAINYALRFSQNEIIIVIDSDSMINRNAIKSIVKHFYDDDVVAVGGYIKVLNSTNFLTNCTTLEVINAWNLIGRAHGFLGTVMIVPGALGAFRKRIVIQRGSYDNDTITEDFDLTIKILKSGGKIKFEGSALSYTEIPSSLKDLYKQRVRWYTGNFQTLIKHFNILTNTSYGLLHKFGYPLILLLFLFRAIYSILIPISLGLAIISGRYMLVVYSLLLFTSLSFILSAISIIMDGQREKLKLILYSPLMIIGYQQILDFIFIKSMFNVIFHKNIKWTRAKRINHP
ncbi:MAG: glycosyltransferase family 2 protein [Nitrosopumilus sp.]|nr:glycosyltransferase family 2 protein [Nitrosopumilus sp.]